MKHIGLFSLSLILLLFAGSSFATHNRAGEITYVQINELQYQFTLTTYTDVGNPGNADRKTAILDFGDGTTQESPRSEIRSVGPNIQRNKYVFIHTFPGYAGYTISYQDPNRNSGVNNMINSVNTPFYIETFLMINPFIGFNNSPVLLLEPVDVGGLNKLFVHNPNAYDVDGDSLSFRLVTCKQDRENEVFGFVFPDKASGYASNRFDIDAATGQLVWENPIVLGLYNIAIMIEEWRYVTNVNRYVRIGYIVRDMQIEIINTNNNPPVIKTLNDTCVLAGTYLTKLISASDQDGDRIRLTLSGGPFRLPPPDTVLFINPEPTPNIVAQTFNWKTSCLSVRKQPYLIVVKAVDNGNPNLVDLEDWRITVVSPGPENLTADAIGTRIHLNWEKNSCGNAVGYKIYRRSGSYPFIPDACLVGVPAYTGYKQIATIEDINILGFVDDNNGEGLSIGTNYCYRVIAYFADGAESYASNEACEKLSRDLPNFTHVSILSTSNSQGTDSVKWAKPTEVDTTQYTPPYQYRLLRASNSNPDYTLLQTYTSQSFAGLNDSLYRDENLNTRNTQYRYRIDFLANDQLIGSAKPASSVYLKSNSRDNELLLSWDVNVPWTNDSFQVFRLNRNNDLFEQIGTSLTNYFSDTGLTNGVEYCYYVKSFGRYTSGGFIEPLINFSQEHCGIPVDTEAPCPPVLSVVPFCDLYRNELSWTNPNTFDTCSKDVIKYRLYKSEFEGGEFYPISSDGQLSPATLLSYTDQNLFNSIAGCYFITAIDSFNNESTASNVVCVDNCPKYSLPNVFTPNGDGINDYFTPIKDSVDFISEVKATIYNRYGNIVYETTDPQIHWDGKDYRSKSDLPEGVYFYSIEFSEIRVKGLKPKTISGFVHLLR